MSPPPADRPPQDRAPDAATAADATFGAAGTLLTEVETARLLGISPRTLRNWRRGGRGPVHVRLGGLVRYAPADVESFIAASRRGTAPSPAERTDPLQASAQADDAAASDDKVESDPGLNLIVRAMMRAQKTEN